MKNDIVINLLSLLRSGGMHGLKALQAVC